MNQMRENQLFFDFLERSLNPQALDEAFGRNVCSLDDKPTNGEFIALCSSKISMKNSA